MNAMLAMELNQALYNASNEGNDDAPVLATLPDGELVKVTGVAWSGELEAYELRTEAV